MERHALPHPEDYAAWLRARGLSPKTVRLYTRVMARAQDLLGGDLRAVDPAALGDYLGSYTGWTRLSYQNALTSTFDWLELTGQIERNPLRRADPREKVKRAPKPEPHPKPFTPTEEVTLLKAATGDLRIWLLLGLRQGLRAHEIAKMRGIDCDASSLRVRGKGGTDVYLPMHPEIWAIAQTMPAGYWFPSTRSKDGHISPGRITDRVGQLLRLFGMTGSIHRARATYGTTLLRNGATPETVRRLMRHKSLVSTQHYVEAANDELRNAIDGLGGAA